MKTRLFVAVIVGFMILLSCRKESSVLSPAVDIRLGHLSDSGGGVHPVSYKNQDTLYSSELDTALAIRVIENNLIQLHLDSLTLENLKFTIYINTSHDNEKFTADSNVFSMGRGMGKNNVNQLVTFDNLFIIPIRFKSTSINDNLVELDLPDFIRISYSSNYTGLSKVKSVLLLKDLKKK